MLLLAAYANHFHNGFHFDDGHSIVENTFVRDIRNIPRYFRDATTFSVLPLNQSYRPVLQATLAIDYWAGGGYRPVAFQVDTFLWFIAMLACCYALFVMVLETAGVATIDSRLAALAAVSVFGLHPAGAETVNYIIQRGEILSTIGVVGALAIYAAWPNRRMQMLWALPLVFGALAKPPALIYPAMLAAYIFIIERPAADARKAAGRDIGVAIAIVIVLAAWLGKNTPPAYSTGVASKSAYLLSQPFVTLRYFGAFFAPVQLSADNDWQAVSGVSDPRTIIGFVFVAALISVAWLTARSKAVAPIAFGLAWFLLALLPTALTPLAEIANDHRMLFPFIGLSLAVTWSACLLVRNFSPGLIRKAVLPVLVIVLVAEAVGVHARNEVWRTDDSLWLDVTLKSPTNGRGLMNYGVSRMEKGDYVTAIDHFERAAKYTPNYSLVYVNLGVAYGAMNRPVDAERAFQKAIQVEPTDWRSHSFYARWLGQVGRRDEALAQATIAATQNPQDETSRLMVVQFSQGGKMTADGYVELSLQQYRAGRYRDSIASAEAALTLKPDYAAAYNNIAAGHNALKEWDQGIAAAQEAVRLDPNLQIAKNNLAYAIGEKAKTSPTKP